MDNRFGTRAQQRAARNLADVHKRDLRAAFAEDLNGGFERLVPVIAALAETLAEITSAHVSPDTTIALFQHLIDDVKQNSAPGPVI